MVDDVVIRALTSVEELRRVESLQREVWRMPEREIVPTHQLLAASGAGGVVLGALDASGALLGFCYGFIGLRDGRPLFYSHMAGVLAAHRGRDIGFRLKRAQREAALGRGLDHMVWTYDPLQRANAHLNLRKLGARASRYYVNYYGEMEDELNRGVESDRLEVDWWLRDPHVDLLMGGEKLPPIRDGGETIRLEIPGDFDALRRAEPVAAQAWRLRTRDAFQRAFAEGYEAIDFVQGAYVLQKTRQPDPR